MPPARDHVKAVFLAALDRATLAERAAFLDQACGPDADLRQRVEALLRAHDRTNLLLDRPAADHLDGQQTAIDTTVSDDQPGVVAGRYTLLQRIGEGGMGTVWMAEQTEPVQRTVALKLIKAGMDSKRVIARFEAERQALALMDHPNIARVLDAGTTEAGRPFFVMEYVRGVPITQYCDEARLSIAERLALFVPVCQAVQHAHQKGVIHRDLKPSNLLVCRYDGTPVPKVIDFGLAKAIHEPLTEHTLHTGHGVVIGTPLYMSPEQAGFNNLDVDTRTDIYALGVILYELLTGTTPLQQQRFQAVQEMLRLIREEEPPRPSARLSDSATLPAVAARRQLDAVGLTRVVRGELDWIVMKALEKDRNRRYDTANSFARDVQRYLAGDVVEARPPSAGYRLKKFVRRHPLELALAGTLALLLLGGVTVAWWQNETSLRRQLEDEKRLAADNARLGRNTEAVAALLGQAEQALHAGDAAKAAVALDAAKKRSAEGGAEKEAHRLARLDADLTLLRELDEVDQFRWTWSEDRFADPAAVARRTRDALARFGADPDAVSVDEAAARVSASAVRERIVTALDRLLLQENTAGVRAALRRVDADPYRDAVRDAVLADDRAKLVELAGRKAALEQPPGFAAFLGDSNFEGIISLERRRQLLRAAVGRRPGDLGLLMTMALTYPFTEKESADEQLRWYQAAVAAAPDNFAAHINLGSVLTNHKGDHDGAIACCQKAIALAPKLAKTHTNLGDALRGKGQVDEAIACYHKAIALDPKYAPAHSNLGSALKHKGQMDEAIACHQKAIALDPKRALAHYNLGNALLDKGQVDEAIACYQKAIALDPKYAPAHSDLGNALFRKGQVDEAIACYQKAIALDPKDALAHTNLGYALSDKGRKDEAIACYQKAIALDPKDATAHFNLGVILCESKGDYDGAIACFQKAIALDPKLALAHYNLGNALRGKDEVDDAIACYRKAIALDPKLAVAQIGLGAALYDKGQLDEAISCWRKAIELRPKHAKLHYNLGNALRGKGQVDEAIDSYQKAIALDPNYAQAHCHLAGALAHQGRFAESLAALKRGHELGTNQPGWPYPSAAWVRQAEAKAALEAKLPALLKGEFQPGDNKERLDLAVVCQARKLPRTATGLYAAAFAADPKLADDLQERHRHKAACCAALAADGNGEDATPLDGRERARLRRQALDWLRADLALYTRQLEGGTPPNRTLVRQRMQHWQNVPDLAGIRDRAALAKLPAEEQKAFTQLWADVAALLKKAQEKPK